MESFEAKHYDWETCLISTLTTTHKMKMRPTRMLPLQMLLFLWALTNQRLQAILGGRLIIPSRLRALEVRTTPSV